MKKLLAAARELQEFMSSQKWRFCFIGGLAYQRWGRPRVTQDADVTRSFCEHARLRISSC